MIEPLSLVFHLDENCDGQVRRFLVGRGVQVVRVALSERDVDLAAIAGTQRAIRVTHDRRFAAWMLKRPVCSAIHVACAEPDAAQALQDVFEVVLEHLLRARRKDHPVWLRIFAAGSTPTGEENPQVRIGRWLRPGDDLPPDPG